MPQKDVEINALCKKCTQDCKQLATLRILSCPNYTPELTLLKIKSKPPKKKPAAPIPTRKTTPNKESDDTPSLFS